MQLTLLLESPFTMLRLVKYNDGLNAAHCNTLIVQQKTKKLLMRRFMQVGMSDNLRNSCLTYKKFRRANYAPTDKTPT
jgi:hypothetical protein